MTFNRDELYTSMFFAITTVFHRFYLRDIEQNTTTVAFECRKTNHLQIGIYFGTIIDDLQRFAIKCRTLVTSQPYGVHIAKKTAEGASDQLLLFLESAKCHSCFVNPISKNMYFGIISCYKNVEDCADVKYKLFLFEVIVMYFSSCKWGTPIFFYRKV